MPLLETLVVTVDEGGSNLNIFFEFLQLPSLVNLEFTSASRTPFDDTDPSTSPSICILLERLDSLRELTLSTNNLSPTTLMESLKHLPYITRLSILHPPTSDWHGGWPPPGNAFTFNDDVLNLLTPSISPINNHNTLCPQLRVIECNPGSFSDVTLLRFIQQRTSHALIHNVQYLEIVDIKFLREKEVDIWSALPPSVLADTQITLDYYQPYILHRNPYPHAGLDDPRRLEMLATATRFLIQHGTRRPLGFFN